MKGTDAYAVLAIAFAQLGQGQRGQAKATYERLAGIRRRGKSFSASGLGRPRGSSRAATATRCAFCAPRSLKMWRRKTSTPPLRS